jgi:hypothetical protein
VVAASSWVVLSRDYRDLVALAMLTPVLISTAILHWPIKMRVRTIIAITVLVLLQAAHYINRG